MCYCKVFALFYFEFEGNLSTSPRGLVSVKGLFVGGFGGGLYLEGLIFGILRYAGKASTNRIHSDMTISFHRNSNVFFFTRKRIMLESPRVTLTREH